MAELHAQNRGLNFIEAAVPSRFGADIARCLSMIAQRAEARVEIGGVRDDHAAIAGRAQIFRWIEADARDVAKRTSSAALVTCADGLRVVFDYRNVALGGDFAERIHVRGKSVQVDCDDSFRFGCDSAAHVRNIEIQSDAIDVGKKRLCA